MFEIILSSEVRAIFDKADAPLARKLIRCFVQLESDPIHHNNIKRLTGRFAGRFRFRIGDWRVVYRVDQAAKRVYVASVAHRSEVYE